MGYVGSVSAACFANDGHDVIGVDINKIKVDMINAGKALIVEPKLSELTAASVAREKLRATTDVSMAIQNSDISFVCVGTPSGRNNSIDLGYLKKVCEDIGIALKNKNSHHTVVCRSTMFPGTMRTTVIPLLEYFSDKKEGKDFTACINPEFMMEGTAVYDFYHPPKNVIGTVDSRGCDLLVHLNKSYTHMGTFSLDIESAEMIKYCDNIWHALKVGYANEIGNVCKELGLDSHQIMNIFCKDTKLNISPSYLKPGFAFGGSCLPKDLRAFLYETKSMDLELPIISSVIKSNAMQIENALKLIISQKNSKIGILGFSFKAGTDDLRESPVVELIERLLGKGYQLSIYDSNVSESRLYGANREYILNRIPHISKLMVPSIEDVLNSSDTIVIGNNSKEFSDIPERCHRNQLVIDLVRVMLKPPRTSQYMGISW